MIRTKFQSGIEVTLAGAEYCGQPTIEVAFSHPKLGAVSFRSSSWGEYKGATGILGWFNQMRVCVTCPKSDYDAAMAEARAIGERELEAIRSGATPIKLHWSDGVYLSGWTCHGRAAKLLVGLGLAKDVSGWGTHVEPHVKEKLGEEFTYAQAAELARPALEAAKTRKEKKAADRQAKFDQARTTGQPVELVSWNDDCCERDYDCSLDIVTEYALPDGSTTTKRIHTH